MKKGLKIIIFLVILAIIIAGIFIIRTKESKLFKNLEGKTIYFYGQTCPHCAKVEKFFEENGIEEKIQFEKREVYNNQENAKLLILAAKRKCYFTENEIGVPFLWIGESSKCIIGDQPIIDYFKEKLKI